MSQPCRWIAGAALALALGLGPLRAGPEWVRLKGPALAAALSDAEVVFDGAAWQHVLATGRVVTRAAEAPAGAASWGEWRVDGDRYCERMPPATDWECYQVEVDGAGGIRFTDTWGNVSTGRVVSGAE